MTLKTICTAVLAALMLTSYAKAEEGSARVDINVVKGKLEFKNPTDKKAKMYYASWVKEEDKKVMRVCAELQIDDQKWTQMTFEVTPSEDGPLTIAIKGRWDKDNRNWIYFDDVSVEGCEKPIENGGFEEMGHWNFPKGQQVLDESLAHSGKGAVLVWHDKAAYQTVQVKAGQPVKITAWVKFCKIEPKEPK